MPDFAPSFGKPQDLTYLAGATIIGGQLLSFTAADTVSPTVVNPVNFAGVAAHDAATGALISVHAGSGVVYETPCGLPAPPATVVVGAATGGTTVAAGTYLVACSYINGTGETTIGPTSTVTVGGTTSTITINGPAALTGATGWGAYISQPNGALLYKQGGTQTIATPLVLTTAPAAVTAPPAANGSGPAAAVLLYAAASGLVSASAGTGYGAVAVGASVRTVNAIGNIRWKSLVG